MAILKLRVDNSFVCCFADAGITSNISFNAVKGFVGIRRNSINMCIHIQIGRTVNTKIPGGRDSFKDLIMHCVRCSDWSSCPGYAQLLTHTRVEFHGLPNVGANPVLFEE